MITPTEGQGPNVSEHVPDGGLRNGKLLITKRNRSLITEIPTRREPIGGGRGCSHQLLGHGITRGFVGRSTFESVDSGCG